MTEEELFRKIKEIMRAKGQTYEGLALEAGLGTSTVYDALNKLKRTRVETLVRMLDALGMAIQITEKE